MANCRTPCLDSRFLLIFVILSLTCTVSAEEYSPGYIGALNSTIVNLMTQLRTYQDYINQAFAPLTTYDKVFPKPISTFETKSPTPAAADKESDVSTRLNSNPVAPSLQIRNTDSGSGSKEAAKKSDGLKTADPKAVHFTINDKEDDFDYSDSDIDTRDHHRKSKIRKHEQSLLTDTCGIYDPTVSRSVDQEGHILWPWSVTLGQEIGHGFLYRCGGTLITLQHIITSAHCLSEQNEVNAVRVQGIKVRIEKVHIHPSYKTGLGYNDIAIAKLTKPLNQTSIAELMPICISPPNDNMQNNLEKIGGFSWTTEWKYSNKDNKLKMVVRNMYTKIQTIGDCETAYKQGKLRESEPNLFPDGMNASLICAKSSKDVCQRNAGIALLTRERRSEQSYLLGVVVKGQASCDTDVTGPTNNLQLPGVFTRLSYFVDWIFDTIEPQTQKKKPAPHQITTNGDISFYYYEN